MIYGDSLLGGFTAMKEKTASAVLVRAGMSGDARRRARGNRHSGGFVNVPSTPFAASETLRDSIMYYMMARRVI